ncbi:hypothetical protein HCN44_009026 [Aphidius gifuensis]|uniref:Low molecular weight phosphotyrosine protein phosphatase n=1 Tax=Aphidius gifuensis TaxID=684658 RepID=A0A834XP94_APHGI|nr:hypothetical protein HCN44_009026 [Aphidius gifuensis]
MTDKRNICRSPIAEAVFAHYIKENGLDNYWDIDSAALIGYHTGKSPDNRAMSTLRDKGIKNYNHRARPITKKDFDNFDWIFGMDEDNIEELNQMKPAGCRAKIELLGSYDPNGEIIIRDPYYDNNSAGFVKAYEQCVRSVQAFHQKYKH